MGRNLGPLNIKDSYEGLVQISGSQLTDGSGSLIPSLEVTASHAVNSDTAISSSYALTASYAENALIPNLQSVTAVGNTSTNGIFLEDITGTGDDSLIVKGNFGNAFGKVYQSSGATIIEASGSGVNDVIVKINGTTVVDIDETLINFEANVDALGQSIQAASFTGSLKGNADTATSASHAINADSAISSSYALTASYAENVVTPTLQQVLDAGDTANADIRLTTTDNVIRTPNLEVYYTAGIGNFTRFTSSFGELTIEEDTEGFNFKSTPASGVDGIIAFTSGSGAPGDLLIINPTQNLITSNLPISASSYISASEFIGDGSGLTGISTDPFPYTGSAEITGSLTVIGPVVGEGTAVFGDSTNSTTDNPGNGVFGGDNNQVTATDPAGRNAILGGTGNTVGGNQQQVIVGGASNSVSSIRTGIFNGNSASITVGNATIIGSAGSSTISGGSVTLLAGGRANTISGGNNNAILAGSGSTVSHNQSVTIGGTGLSTTKDDEVVVPSLVATELTASGLIYPTSDGSNGDVLTTDGAGNLTLQPAAGGAAFPYTGSAQITGSLGVTGSFEVDGIAIGNGGNTLNTIIGNGASAGTGTYNTYIGELVGRVNTSGFENTIVGTRAGYDLTAGFTNNFYGALAGQQVTTGDENQIFGGNSLPNLKTGNQNIALGHYTGQGITGDGNTIIGNRLVTGALTDSIVIGVGNGVKKWESTGNTTTIYDDEVSVTNLDINGTVVQNVQALTITSNTASLDASTGQMFTLGLQNAADTHLELSNQVAGQTFSLKITNNATAAGTISFDSQFEFEGGTAFTATAATNAVDILTFTTFDGSNVQCVGSKNFS